MKDNELEQKLCSYFQAEAESLNLPAENELKALAPKPKRKRFSPRRYLTAAACFLLVACVAVIPLFRNSSSTEFPLGGESDSAEQSTDESVSEIITPQAGLAPWENGSLRLTSVTYKNVARQNALQPIAKTSTTAENVSISMLADTKISGCVNAELLSITPTEGKHVGCDGVFYDIRKDSVFCLACHIKDKIADNPYYIDICIRLLIEEHLITLEEILAGIIDYKSVYLSLDNETAKECFANGNTPTCESLAFDYAFGKTAMYDALMEGYQYPIIRVIEYGENEDRCLFTIGSPVSDVTWGAYVFELDTGKVIKLDGETVGFCEPINGYMGGTPDEFLAVNLSIATGVSVTEDYSKILVTLPYFVQWYDTDENGRLVPVYTGQNVIVFDVDGGTYEGLLGNNSGQDTSLLDLPTQHAKSYGELVYFPTDDNAWCLFADGHSYKLQGELLRLTERDGGGYTAVMKKGNSYEAYALEGEQATLLENEAIRVLDGNKRVLLSDGSAEILWENEPAAMVMSADGRFLYLYFEGDGFVTCFDIDSGKKGELALSGDFVSQAGAVARAEYLLFLNASENRLLIAYCKNGALIFDSQAFLENEDLEPAFQTAQIDDVFERNFKKALPYFYNGETNVTFADPKTVVEAATVLGFDALYQYATQGVEHDMSPLIIEIASRVADVADYTGNKAEISGRTLNGLLAGMTFDVFDEAYRELFGHFETIHYTDNPLSSYWPDDSICVLAEDIANGVLTYVYGYVSLPEGDLAYLKEHQPKEYEIYTELYRRLNNGLDVDNMKALQKKLADYLVPVMTDAGIDPKHPTYTGYAMNKLLEEHLAELVSIALNGKDYGEFIRSCGFVHPYGDAYYSGRTDKRFDSMLLCDKTKVNTDALRVWMDDVEFVEGAVDITREAGIYAEWELGLFYVSYYMYPGTEIIAVGYGADGKTYAVISGYYAEISKEQFDSFDTLCGEGEPFDHSAGVEELLNQLRDETW